MKRSTRFTRTAAVAVAAGAMLGVTACSGGDNTATSDGPIEITYMHRLPDGEGMTAVQETVDRWNEENPDIQVKPVKFDGASSDMILKLETDIKAGNGACLAQVSYSEVPQLYVKGLLQDVAGEAEKYASEFSDGAYAGMKVGDAVVGLPQDVGPLVYYYNATVFDELGLEAPTTLDALIANSDVAAKSGKYVAAFTPDEALNWLSAQSAAAGDSWFGSTDDGWTVHAEGEGSQTVADLWQGLIDEDKALVTERWGEGFTKALTDGTLIGHVGAAWEAGFLLDPLEGTPAEGEWRVAQLPDFGAGQVTGPDGGSGVAVTKDCEHPEEAMEFNAWFNTQIDDLASQGLVVAATTDTPTTSEKMKRQFGGQDVLAELSTAAANMNPEFTYAPGFASLTKMNEVAAGVAGGSTTVSDIFSAAQSSAVSALKDLGLPVAE